MLITWNNFLFVRKLRSVNIVFKPKFTDVWNLNTTVYTVKGIKSACSAKCLNQCCNLKVLCFDVMQL